MHVRPAVAPLRWAPRLPGDKSITHRAILMGALAEGTSSLEGHNEGEDCLATLRAVEILGARVERQGGRLLIHGRAGRMVPPDRPLDLGNSGTGLRLLLGLLAAQPFSVVLTGDASLCRRPVERVLAPLRRMGARAEAPGDHAPVTLTGGPLHGISHRLELPSAQLRSALLLAGIQAEGRSCVQGGEGARDHTERLLPAFGCPVHRGADEVCVEGPRRLSGTSLRIPGDPSAGTFYLMAAGLLPGSEVELEGVGLNPTRIHHFDVLRRMGVELAASADPGTGPEPWGRVAARAAGLVGVEILPAEVPGLIDELPALAVLAAMARGRTRITGAGELRHKESNRLETVAQGLAAIGARVTSLDDGWLVDGSGGAPLPGGEVLTRGDHRVAMAFAMAGLATRQGVTLLDEPGISSSDPFFLSNLKALEA